LEVYLFLSASFFGAGFEEYPSFIADFSFPIFKTLYLRIIRLLGADLSWYESLSDRFLTSALHL
jgi:hypothetical protein